MPSPPVAYARQICDGANRLIEVTRWPKDDKIPCSHCALKLVGFRVMNKGDRHPITGEQRKYLRLPNHRPIGAARPDAIDWSQEG
jgi:hypothetical protein